MLCMIPERSKSGSGVGRLLIKAGGGVGGGEEPRETEGERDDWGLGPLY